MKKNSKRLISVFILCIVTAMGIAFLRIHEDAVTVTEKYHERDMACDASFMMWSMERGGIQYGFDQKGFTREEAMDYMLEIEENIHTIWDRMKDADSFSRDR